MDAEKRKAYRKKKNENDSLKKGFGFLKNGYLSGLWQD